MNNPDGIPDLHIYYEKKKILEKESGSLTEILGCLSEEEFRQFKLFLRSPFFNKDKTQVQLFDRLLTAIKKGSEGIRGKDLIKKIYGGTEEEEKGVQKLLDGLKRLEQLAYKFIGICELSLEPLEETRLQTIGLKKRKNSSLFYRTAARYEKMLEQKPVTIMRLAFGWWLDHQRYFHQNAQQDGEAVKWFEAGNQKIDLLYQLVKLRYQVESYNLRNVVNRGIAVAAPQDLFPGAATERQMLEVIWLYREVLPLVRDPFDLCIARRFLHHFVNKSRALAAADRVVLAKLLYNALLRSINGPNPQGMSQLVHLSKYIVQYDLYLFEGVVSDDEYLNLAIMSGVGGAFKFQAYFIEHYAQYLEEDVREKAVSFANIYRRFHLGNHEEAISGLKTLFPPNTQDKDKYVFRAKALLLRAYVAHYLQGNYACYEDYLKSMENFRRYLLRHEGFSNRYYDSYRNLITFCNALVSCCDRRQFGPEVVKKMEQKLDKLGPVIAYSWLKEQIRMLDRRRGW